MYLDCRVKLPPETSGKITVKTISGTPYVYYEHGRTYHKDKGYNTPKRTCIGKKDPEQPGFIYPNEKFLKFFPRELLPIEKDGPLRSGCIRIGAYLVIRKVVSDYHLDEMIARIIGKDAGLFMDLAAYSIITEDNAGQYYPDYAYDHALFTDNMKIYSDSKVSDFLQQVTVDQRIMFLNEWNRKRDHRERIYISYDSTNKTSQAGDIDLVELGHSKDGIEREIFNYSIAYDRTNREPLFYETYPGSIVDISQLQYTLKKAKSYGYERVGFILDRGYFCKENIGFMDECGYAFVIMIKGMKSLVSDLVLKVQGTFENDRKCSIRSYKVSGTTVKQKLFADDKKDRYFHIYYDDGKKAEGYFVIITSEKMTAEEALNLYKSRDDSEKTFRGDKSYLGAHCERVYSEESQDTKIFIGFVATIIRNRIYTLLKDEAGRMDKKQNYMTVPAALKELEKIELLKGADGEYSLDYAVTATQKAILNAFDMTAENVGKQALGIASDLARIRFEAIETTADSEEGGR